MAKEPDFINMLWSIQATLVALVFPIVISFVALLLQKRPAAKASLQIYLSNSRSWLAIFSSLALVLVMGMLHPNNFLISIVQYLIIPIENLVLTIQYLILTKVASGGFVFLIISLLVKIYQSISIVDILFIWFVINIWLTFHFLSYTLKFLKPSFQINEIKKYSANVLLPKLYKFYKQESKNASNKSSCEKNDEQHINCNEILVELETNARMSAISRNIVSFEYDYRHLIEVHQALLISANAIKIEEDNGALISLSLFPDTPPFVHFMNHGQISITRYSKQEFPYYQEKHNPLDCYLM